jgi:hypothetical protein
MHGQFRLLFCTTVALPCLALAGPFGIPPLPGPFAVGGGLAKLSAPSAAPVTDPAQMVGHWRSIGVDDSDPQFPMTDTAEMWIGAEGSLEMRMGLSGIDAFNPDERYTARIHAKGRWASEAGNFIVTMDQCRIASTFLGSSDDCSNTEGDTSALSMYRIADIGGRRALIFLFDASESAAADDTLFYVGAAPAFIVAPVLDPMAVRRRASSRIRGDRRLAFRDGGLAAMLPDGRMLDLRGRAWPARRR